MLLLFGVGCIAWAPQLGVRGSATPTRSHTATLTSKSGEEVAENILAFDVPSVVVGGGRIGGLLFDIGCQGDVIVKRGEPIPSAPSSGPIYVCTRNEALADIIAKTPAHRREDLVFLQNGMIGEFLWKQGLPDASQVLVYLAVAKRGEKPTDGITDTNPEGLTIASGKWAGVFAARLKKAGLTCHVKSGDDFFKAMLEKHVWLCAFMLTGALHGGVSVGEVESKHSAQLRATVEELCAAGEAELEIKLEAGCFERLAAYGRAVGHFPTAVKEFDWRNGWFHEMSQRALKAGKPDPTPLHTAGLKQLGVIQ